MEDQQNNIEVSISCITYNHAPYIRQCLDGFLMQQCNFDFEILIHDDASTDGTQEIIREYQEKYPDIIKPLIQKENQWSKGIRSMNATFNFPRAQGKYIALCEGDDYWTDPLKLQKQVSFLERNKNYAMVFHNALVKNETINENSVFNSIKVGDVTGGEILSKWIVPTASVVFKKDVIEKSKKLPSSRDIIFGDIMLFLAAVECGKVYFISDECWSVYRKHTGGVTFKKKITEKHYLDFISHYKALNKIFAYKYNFLCKRIQLKTNISLLRYYLINKEFLFCFKQIWVVLRGFIDFFKN
ncbi:glycosyltransferase [Empedobacter stercoris]|uniref:Glycosyltransferase n=1 Tax=Empedobacter stercoris TaxID=1628248 RepID=A0ABX1WM96_9FLAO|nr:glycosyltransferase [Empedobacter stercoris]NOJ75676.1 glycosyltransferase [Empedobacter stercoris]